MPTITITVDQAAMQRVIDALRDISGAEVRRLIANKVSSDGVIPRLRDYPPQSGKPMAFVSDRQRRAFFAKLRSGAITVPYRRTFVLQNSWAQVGDGFVIASTTPYAAMVQGAPGQVAYHKGNWKTVGEIADAVEAGPAAALGEAAIEEWIRSRF